MAGGGEAPHATLARREGEEEGHDQVKRHPSREVMSPWVGAGTGGGGEPRTSGTPRGRRRRTAYAQPRGDGWGWAPASRLWTRPRTISTDQPGADLQMNLCTMVKQPADNPVDNLGGGEPFHNGSATLRPAPRRSGPAPAAARAPQTARGKTPASPCTQASARA